MYYYISSVGEERTRTKLVPNPTATRQQQIKMATYRKNFQISRNFTEEVPVPLMDRNILEGLKVDASMKILQPPAQEYDETMEDLKIKEYRYVGSYKWLEADTPTMLVPGKLRSTTQRAACR